MSRTQRRNLGWTLWAFSMACFVGLTAGSLSALAQSAPPTAVVLVPKLTTWQWFAANSGWLIPLTINILATVATGLSDYPKAEGAAKTLRLFVAILGSAQFRDAVGSLKAPLAPPAKPV